MFNSFLVRTNCSPFSAGCSAGLQHSPREGPTRAYATASMSLQTSAQRQEWDFRPFIFPSAKNEADWKTLRPCSVRFPTSAALCSMRHFAAAGCLIHEKLPSQRWRLSASCVQPCGSSAASLPRLGFICAPRQPELACDPVARLPACGSSFSITIAHFISCSDDFWRPCVLTRFIICILMGLNAVLGASHRSN